MKKTILALIASAFLSACGGAGDGAPPPAAPPATDLDTRMAGTWPGTLTITPQGFAATNTLASLDVVVAGRTATISKVCPDGTGTVNATGSDRAASWTGSLACPPVAVGPCPSVVATVTSATGTLSADGLSLTVDALGSATACGFTPAFTMRFVGAK